ncbi:Gfo/Idh/MocA family protein [Pyxidicoccus sp. 3LG]
MSGRTRLDALLDMGLDGLVIATPSAFHAEQSIRALERGLAVFCQKPLGRSAEETKRVVDAARAADRLLGVDLSYRYTTGMRQLRERIHGGALGDIYAVNLVFHNAYGPDKAWFYDAKLAGGGCVMDLGIHLVDLTLWVLGFPDVRRVSSQLLTQGRPLTRRGEAVEDFAAAQLELANGTAVQLACSWKLPAGCDAVIEASFYGTRGGAAFRNVNGSFYDFTADLFWGTSRERSPSRRTLGGRAAVDWATRLAHGARFDPESERLVQVRRRARPHRTAEPAPGSRRLPALQRAGGVFPGARVGAGREEGPRAFRSRPCSPLPSLVARCGVR